jgi:glucosylceramidase
MNRRSLRIALSIIVASLVIGLLISSVRNAPSAKAAGETVNVWLTTPDQANLLAQKSNVAFSSSIGSNATTISVNEGATYQQMTGFGASMTDSSAYLLYDKMSASQRSTLMNNLFNVSSGIGLDFLRQPIGSSDLSLNEYTYDDLASGQTDPTLSRFSIAHDSSYIIPVLQQALQINPNITIMGTPWSPPAWMKSNGSLNAGGTLLTSDYSAYAQYLADFIKAYQAAGIPIYAITPQNEPLNTNNMPTLDFPASSETTFIANNLGPTLAANGLSTRIFGFDHNWDTPSYPTTIMNNATANSYTPASAWHCYAGDASAMTAFHNAFPTKDIYQTECSGGTWEGSNWPNGFQNTLNLLINSTRNWSKSVVRWGLALDTNNGPYLNTSGACSTCRGIVTVDQSTGNVTYNSDYYALGQASKFVRPGAYRIDSNSFGAGNLEDVAFKNPDGSKVLVAYNNGSSSNTFQVQWNNEAFSYTLPAGAAATFTWSGTQTGGNGAPVGSTIWLQATNNNNYVSARTDQSNAPLDTSATQVQAWEEFDVVDAGNGLIALRAHANNNYVSTRIDQSNAPLNASATQVQAWEEFHWLPQSNGTVALQAVANNNYVSVRTDQTNTPLDASVTQVQGWEQFRWGQV